MKIFVEKLLSISKITLNSMLTEEQKQNQQKKYHNGLEKYLVSKLMDELDDPYDVEDYKTKVKDRCFSCGNICNENKDYSYYLQWGNQCRECSGRLSRKHKKK